MTATVRILCGPAGSGKTQRLLERYRTVARQAVGTALWLGPSHRHVEALRPQLLQGSGGCLGPNLFTFQDFAEEIIRSNDPPARPLSHLQRRLLVDDLIAELHTRGQLSHFHGVVETRGFAESVLALLAELKQNEIWPEKFAEVIAERTARRNGQDGSRKDEQCSLLYSEYQARLIRHQLYDLEGRLWYARDLLSRGQRRPFASVRAVFVDGFTDFTRTQQDILEALGAWVEELWLTLPDEPGDERAELFTRPRLTCKRLQIANCKLQIANCKLQICNSGPPAGLSHLERQLFRPLRSVVVADDAEGIHCIEAPGLVGETRLVARQIKKLLLHGTPAGDILVTMRDVLPYADLVREVFAEYGIPVDVEGIEPLLRNTAVATLIRTLRLPEEDWQFAAVTALLRSSYFRPDWPEVRQCAEIAQHSEALLRLLGEPRSRAAYLKAVHKWSERVQPGLEDEQAEESRRRRTHDLARRCRGFLDRFFHAWDGAPHRGTWQEHTAWVRHLATDLGIVGVAAENARDAAALRRLWEELERWLRIERLLHGPRIIERGHFLRLLGALAGEAGLARAPRGPGRVRVLSASLARGLKAEYVFVMGLGERSFPRLTAPEPFFDESERQALKQSGLDFPCVSDMMPDEMLLFYQTVTSARRRLVLSFPAVDEKGQALLPSSFLGTLRECFAAGAIPTERRQMLIEGFDREAPLSSAEYRVQVARGNLVSSASLIRFRLSGDLAANLQAAAELVRQRFHFKDHTPYDGLLRDPAVIAEVEKMFGPDRILSPTALEGYIACPFRFFLGNVLRLELLEEPNEEIESTDRGLVFHRALSRLHTQLKSAGIHEPMGEVDAHIMMRLEEAVNETADRASPASEVLWRLEGQRLKRLATKYRPHWENFVKPWLPRQVRPQPHLFEVSFGLPPSPGETPHEPLVIQSDGIEVRISGRIDRVDVADLPNGETGFWIIDYKTGHSSHYTGTDLREFRRLQLTLYALAAEQVLLTDRNARPLGLAYWLVADTGPKVALPSGRGPLAWFEETAAWRSIREQLQAWVVTLVRGIRQGEFPLKPRSELCTQTCDFAQVCRISQSRSIVENKSWQLSLPVVP
jgi:ATP-dependent helicase/DNAse subunit B